MENDYNNFEDKLYINDVLKKSNFVLDYSEAGGWGQCYFSFFEVWINKT